MAPSPSKWDSREMFELHVYDYLTRNNLHQTAAIFAREAGLNIENSRILDAPEGFLKEWFGIFTEIHSDLFTTKPSSQSQASGPPNSSSQEVSSSTQDFTKQIHNEKVTQKKE